jgi:hypothetical protein
MPRPYFFVGKALARCHDPTFSSDRLWHGATASRNVPATFVSLTRPHGNFRQRLSARHGFTKFSDNIRPSDTPRRNCRTRLVCRTKPPGILRQGLSARQGFTERSGEVCTKYTALFFLCAVAIIPRHSIANISKSLSFRSEANPPASPTGSFWRE